MYPQVKCTTRRQRTLSSSHQKRRHTSCDVVFGANETAGLRNGLSYHPTQYSVDWTIVVTSYIKKQFADIALPSAP
ncbi:hypothetical protein P692DRAFT_20828571 [Suillus brevipes Sb2]|nr:hypothetical protein P692DRAFT_20828571 [Suillus brevipes Sb2]